MTLTRVNRYIVNQMYPVLDSTPRLLKSVNEHGLVIDPPEENTIVQEFPIMTRLHSNERVGEFVRSYASQWSASNAMKILRYTHDYTRDDVAAVAEELTDLANEYSN